MYNNAQNSITLFRLSIFGKNLQIFCVATFAKRAVTSWWVTCFHRLWLLADNICRYGLNKFTRSFRLHCFKRDFLAEFAGMTLPSFRVAFGFPSFTCSCEPTVLFVLAFISLGVAFSFYLLSQVVVSRQYYQVWT